MDTVGLRLVNSIVVNKDLTCLVKKGVNKDDLFDESYTALKWVFEYVESSGEFPTVKMVSETLGIVFPEEVDPLDYAVEAVRKRALSLKVNRKLESAIKAIDARNPDEALKILSENSDLRDLSKISSIVSYTKSVAERIVGYKEKKVIKGLETPWSVVNKIVGGWIPCSFNVAAAKTSHGKSWLTCIAAEHALNDGENVLLVTMEMPSPRISKRLDAIHYKIPFWKLRNADFTEEELEEWKEKSETTPFKGELLIADKNLVKEVSDINNLIRDYKPSIVFVDGGYLLEGKKKGAWDNTVDVVKSLQISAEVSGIPWIVTTQLGDKDEKGKDIKRGPKVNAWNVRYGKEWLLYAFTFIGLYQDDELRLSRKSMMKVLKTQDAVGDSFDEFYLNWDLSEMNFSEIRGAESTLEGTSELVEF